MECNVTVGLHKPCLLAEVKWNEVMSVCYLQDV